MFLTPFSVEFFRRKEFAPSGQKKNIQEKISTNLSVAFKFYNISPHDLGMYICKVDFIFIGMFFVIAFKKLHKMYILLERSV